MNKEETDKEFKNVMRKLVIQAGAIALSIWLSILVMEHGWGLKPVSWWWIIGVGVAGRFMAEILVQLGK